MEFYAQKIIHKIPENKNKTGIPDTGEGQHVIIYKWVQHNTHKQTQDHR